MSASARTDIVLVSRFTTGLVTRHPAWFFRIGASIHLLAIFKDMVPDCVILNIVIFCLSRWAPSIPSTTRVGFVVIQSILESYVRRHMANASSVEDGTFHHGLQKSPFQSCLQRSSSGLISDLWKELGASTCVRPKICLTVVEGVVTTPEHPSMTYTNYFIEDTPVAALTPEHRTYKKCEAFLGDALVNEL